jgi:hypothetical protein
MHDMLKFDSDWKGTAVALGLIVVFWAWDNKWAILLGGGAVAGIWLAQ